MNKRSKYIFAVAVLLVGIFAGEVMADNAITLGTRVTAIPSVRIHIDTTELQAGNEFGVEADAVVSVPENAYYSLNGAEWINPSAVMKIGDIPRMKVYLSAYPKEVDHERYTQLWLFSGGYGAGNVYVSKGTAGTAEIRDSGYSLVVEVTVDPIKGTYTQPQSAYWEATLGKAAWIPSENDSGIYDIVCRRDDVTVKKLTNYTGNTYDFYPYMTKPGGYSFEVRCAVPEEYKSLSGVKPSDYLTSSTQVVREDQVSDGSGQTKDDEDGGSSGRNPGNGNFPNGTGTENVAGWITDSTGSYFRYPGGEYVKNSWLKLSDGWYRFDEKGRMITGWFLSPDSCKWYYMDPNTGIMKTGWLMYKDHWYFLNTADDGFLGAMITGWQRINGELYYFNESGIMVTGWYQLGGQWYYFYPQGTRADGKYGLMARNVKVGEFTIGPEGYWVH